MNETKEIHRSLNIALLSLAIAIAALLIIGTIFSLVRPRGSAPILILGSSQWEEFSAPVQTEDIRIFYGLGRMRIPLVDGSVMVLSIAFPFNNDDIAFSEELAARVGDLREIISDYFSALSQEALPQEAFFQIDEDSAKQEILRRFNSSLRLGRISELYFTDLMIIGSTF